MRSPLRLAAALLLVYPTLMLVGKVIVVIHDGWSSYLLGGLPLLLFIAAVGVNLWRGKQWAYGAALVCSVGLALVLLLYEGAVQAVWGAEAWQGISPVGRVLAFLPEAALTAAFALLVRDATFAAERWRALKLLLAALAAEGVLMGLIAWLGVGSMFGFRAWYQLVLSLSQTPGEILLSQMGLCCGIENETIISDFIDPHWGPITWVGIPTLIVANTLGLVPVVALARVAVLRLRVRRMGAAAA